jgi:hypothetical protein
LPGSARSGAHAVAIERVARGKGQAIGKIRGRAPLRNRHFAFLGQKPRRDRPPNRSVAENHNLAAHGTRIFALNALLANYLESSKALFNAASIEGGL